MPFKGRIYDCNYSDSSCNPIGLQLREESIYDLLGGRLSPDIPAWKYENRGMALQCPGKNLRPLYP